MPKLTMLRPRLSAPSPVRTPILASSAGSTSRIRGRQWMKMKTAALVASDHWCVECLVVGVQRLAVEVDHRIPLWRGGSNEPSNLQGLCKAHHDAKTAQEAGERARQG
ncbi:HNH endonuclease [Herbaspirillum seropedicae]|uniref:HNH endonuclease n=1 Tax=Herbaspirillum seropedicae TaxID=964 RepID=UPI0035B56C91